MDLEIYRNHLKRRGKNLAEVKKNQSDAIMDRTFKNDPNYKKVYILTNDGWKWQDAKYQMHVSPSILKDAVDYMLQFPTKVHYPIGSYVIVPDDTDYEINLTESQLENPWSQPVEERTQWWFIVGRDDSRSYVRYNILKCNYEFKWMWKNQIMKCFGSVRVSNSYTSGRWLDEISTQLDNVTSLWMPDILYTYTNFKNLGLDNNQTLTYDKRLMIGRNKIDPKIYQVSKVVEGLPDGIIKITLKQDDFNERRDSVKYGICDYYDDDGHTSIDIVPVTEETKLTSIISWMTLNDDGELIMGEETQLQRGKSQYFSVAFYNDGEETVVEPEWKISGGDDYSVGLMTITKFDNETISVKPAKAGSLVGKTFILAVSDIEGNYYSSIELEVY